MISAELGKQLEGFVAELVEKGRYNSKSEVLREGVRLIQDREARLAALDSAIARGLADADAIGEILVAKGVEAPPQQDVLGEVEDALAGLGGGGAAGAKSGGSQRGGELDLAGVVEEGGRRA